MNNPKVIHDLATVVKGLRKLYKYQNPSAPKDKIRGFAAKQTTNSVILASIQSFELWVFGAVRVGNDWDARISAMLAKLSVV